MKKLNSIAYSDRAFNLTMFLLRVGAGILVIPHGYQKLVNFAELKTKFISFMGIGQVTSLSLAIFAEFFCAIFLIIGLFTRLTVIPLIIVMLTVVFKVNGGDIFGGGEKGALFLLAFLAILFCGPGKASVDAMIR